MLKKVSLTLLAIIVLSALIVTGLSWQPSAPSSQAFINGNIITMNADQPSAEAVLVQGQKIVAVGSNQKIQAQISSDTIIHDLRGKTLIPGFIDAHGHFPGSGMAELSADLNSPPIGDVQTMGELLQRLKRKASQTPKGDWILGIGYDDSLLAEKRHPNRQELDQALPDHPVFVWHVSGHMGVANSAALTLGGIDESTPNPDGGVYVKNPATAKLTGLLEENAALAVQTMAMDFSLLQFFQMTKSAAADYARVGVTTAQSGAIETQLAQGMLLASKLGMIPMRLELWPIFDTMGPKLLDGSLDITSLETDMINIGAIKIMADGSIQGFTGYLSSPYHSPFHGDDQYRGYPRLKKQKLINWIEKYHRAGYQVAIHGNGDASIDDILIGIELAQQKFPRQDTRHTIIHAQMARDDQLDKMKALGVIPSFFVAHTYYWGDRHRDIFMGPERAARMSPAASALAKGLPFTLHMDTPVVPMNPLFLMWTAVNRLSSSGQVIGAEQRIDAYSALKAVTIDAAWQLFEEDNRGSIEVGKWADLVVLSASPLENPTRIKDLNVELTMVGGRTIFSLYE